MRVFPEGFFYNKKNDQPRTPKMIRVFAVIARLKGNVEEKETGTSEIILRNSGWVASTGIILKLIFRNLHNNRKTFPKPYLFLRRFTFQRYKISQ